jgi:hypothetical protein
MIGECFRPLGDIKAIEKQESGIAFTVKFFDLRAAKKAIEESGKIEIAGGKVFTEFNWQDDDGSKGRPKDLELPAPRGRAGEERRGRGRFQGQFMPPPYPGYPPTGFIPPPPGYPGYPPVFPGYPPPQFSGPPITGFPSYPVFTPPIPEFQATTVVDKTPESHPKEEIREAVVETAPRVETAAQESETFQKQLASLLKILQ